MDISPRSTSYVVDDNSWLDSEHGTDAAEPVTLNLALFDASQFANGFIPSGCALGKVTSTGLYGPYDDTASDGRQVLVGHLLGGVKVAAGVTTGSLGGAMQTHGRIKENRLPFQSGQTGRGYVDANGKADVAGRIRYRTA